MEIKLSFLIEFEEMIGEHKIDLLLHRLGELHDLLSSLQIYQF